MRVVAVFVRPPGEITPSSEMCSKILIFLILSLLLLDVNLNGKEKGDRLIS